MSLLLMNIHNIHSCLKIICDVESDILDSSIKVFFKRKNYDGNEEMLNVVSYKLYEIHEELDNYHSESSGINRVVCDAMEYVRSLISSTKQLISLNGQLRNKSNGGRYSLTQYNMDLSEFWRLQENYCILGDRLTTDYKLYALEIERYED